jgi:molecular chaperone GrpE
MIKKPAKKVVEETVIPMDELKKHAATATEIPADGNSAAPPPEDETSELEKCRREAKDNHEKYLRLAADFDNYRKRVARERDELTKYANEKLIRDVLPIVDNLERALDHASNSVDFDAFVEGLKLVDGQLRAALTKHGVEKIEVEGCDFDPNFHEAVMQVESPEHDYNKVVEEFERGYLLNGRLLRPSKVSVAAQKKDIDEQ